MNRPEGDEGAIVYEAEQAIDEQFGAKIRACRRLYDYAKSLPQRATTAAANNSSDAMLRTDPRAIAGERALRY